jgi:hypothetical protein
VTLLDAESGLWIPVFTGMTEEKVIPRLKLSIENELTTVAKITTIGIKTV